MFSIDILQSTFQIAKLITYVQCVSIYIQGDQLNMAVCFLYLFKGDLSSVHIHSSVHWSGHFLYGTRTTRPCLSGRVVEVGMDLGRRDG